METPKEYHYTYYSYEDWGRGYFGVRTCKCLPEEDINYFGSFTDKSFRPTQKIILKGDYPTREEANVDEIILHDYYDVANNPHFANKSKASSTGFYVATEDASRNGKLGGPIGGNKVRDLGIGIHGQTKEQRSKHSKKIGNKHKENKTGVCGLPEEILIENGRKNGNKVRDLGIGIHGQTKEERIKNAGKGGKIGGKILRENKKGIFNLTPEQISENSRKGGKKTNNQRWKCCETGYISTSAGLSHYQKARGIDTTKRERIG
jgi:hypothetical protein